MKNNVYQMVTDRVLEKMKEGIIPWKMPWSFGANECINYVTRKPYSLLNSILLGVPGEYVTFKQVQNLGGRIKKGEKANMVVYYQRGFDVKENVKDECGNDVEKRVHVDIPLLKYYNVWHISQVDGIESKLESKTKEHKDPIDEAESVINEYIRREGITFSVGGTRAYYSPSQDFVAVPTRDSHTSAAEYYSTAFHELTHSTGHKSRLNRFKDDKVSAFGNEDYTKEELCAELGAAFSLARLCIDCTNAFTNSVAYIQNWARYIKDNPKEIVFASARAEKAVKYMFNEK